MSAPIPPSRAPTHTCFIGNLPYDITENQLKDLFAEVGPIKKFRIVTDKDTGRQKGFAFCEYFDIPTAQSAQRNLNAHELSGRHIRVDFAEDKGPGHDRDPTAPRPPRRNEPVGMHTAANAAQAVSGLVGGTPPPGAGGAPDPITSTLAGMSRKQLYDILSQMKGLINQNPGQARQIMVQNPQLTKALFQAQVLLGMVPAPGTNGPLQPPATATQPQPSPQYQPPPAQQQQQPSPQYQQQPAPQYGQPQQYLQPSAANGAPPAMYAAPGGGGAYVPPPVQHPAGPGGGDPYAAQQQAPPPAQHQYGAPQQPPVYQQHSGLPAQVDPRYQAAPPAADPRQQQQPLQQAPPAGGGQAALDQHKALLEKVMSLTPAQIELLPPEQKAQVIALQTQMRQQGVII